jgi:translocator protein
MVYMQNLSGKILKPTNIIFYILTVIINSLAGGTTLIGGKLTATISDSNPTLITPAGYVFSIWGIIYILLGAFVIYQALPSRKTRGFTEKIGWLFVLSNIINIAWIFFWQFEYLTVSVVLIFLLLATLIAIYVRLGVGKAKVSLADRLAVHLPFSVYLGWITVASIANVATALVSLNWDGAGISAETWAILVVAVALVITSLMLITKKDMAYSLVIIWALIGIGTKQSGNQTVVLLTQISAVIVAIMLIATIIITKMEKKHKAEPKR